MVNVDEMSSPLNGIMFACPRQDQSTDFRLVDEFGCGKPYAALAYTAIDSEGLEYKGHLDAEGNGKVTHHCAGPISVAFADLYQGSNDDYNELVSRKHYPLQITDLQVRAEQTRYLNNNATRTRENPAQACADHFLQVEVRHLVKHIAHLPPEVFCHFPVTPGPARLMGEHGKLGVALMPQKHTVLEVRPLRALRPMLSTAPEFCALNLYQLALMSTLSYCPFGQKPDAAPIETALSFTQQPSVGNWFADALAKFEELWRVDPGQKKPCYPLYEDVPYSKRLEIVPFDPVLYPVNNIELGVDQEHPAKVHFFDDSTLKTEPTDTQAFITHNDELILIAVRGTLERADAFRDADALQVPFTEGDGKVHRGFYGAAKKAVVFARSYLDRFHAGQKLLICGHSLGGAVALLLAEMLRRREGFDYNIQLYTYGAPRTGDATFARAAEPLVHYRMVNHNDPVPSVPGSWMNTKADVYGTGVAVAVANAPAGLAVFVGGLINWTGEPYEHHGTLRHFLPVEFGGRERSSILWMPSCDTIVQHAACEIAIGHRRGLPDRQMFIAQILHAGNHSMVGGYIPGCWATLRRWQEAQASSDSLVTRREYEWVETALVRMTRRLRDEDRHRGAPNGRGDRPAAMAISQEIDKINTTLARLATLRTASVSERDVYGSVVEQAESLAHNLARWQAHPENRAAEQLAMAPGTNRDVELISGTDGYVIGRPYSLDVDSII